MSDQDARAPCTDEGFLHRWSRRKHEARDATRSVEPEAGAEAAPMVPAVSAPRVDDAQEQGIDKSGAPAAQPPGDDDMPPLDSLGPDSEVSAFFSPRVSEGLRRAALRRIFHQPQFNVTDGLDDYCADYRKMIPLGSAVTADMRLQMERARESIGRVADAARKLSRETSGDAPGQAGPPVVKDGESDGDA